MKPEQRIKAGRVEFVQAADGAVVIRFKTKAGEVAVPVNVKQLERWAMRQLRDGVFA
jgi:ribosomal protein L15E